MLNNLLELMDDMTEWIPKYVLVIFILCTFPFWVVPYSIYRHFEKKRVLKERGLTDTIMYD